MHTHTATSTDMEGAMWTRCGATSTFDQRRSPACDTHGTQQVGVEYQFAGPCAVRDRPQRTDREPVQRRGRGALLTGESLGGLQDGACAGVPAVVADDVGGEGIDRHHLRDDVEVAARMKLYINMGERFQPGPELAAGTAHALGDRADQAVVAGQQGDDAVGLAELVLAHHDRPIPIQPHPSSLSPQWDNRGD